MKIEFKHVVIALVSLLMLVMCVICFFEITSPYEITANGQRLVMVESKEAGKNVLKKVLVGYLPDSMELKSINVDKDIKVSQISVVDYKNRDQVMTEEEAVEYLKANNETENALFDATVTSEIVKKEKFMPDTEYHAVDTALAGTTRVEREGKQGVREVTYSVTSINGKVKKEEAVDTKVIEEGEAPIIYKGTLGVPDDEDWETYEGNPVFNDGNDIATTALQYLGCPYKYGGYSFKNGIDCVQYIRNIYRMYGVELPNNHPGLRKVGSKVNRNSMKPGDIICYKHHVAIYIGNGRMAEATRKGGTKTNKVRGGIITIRRVKH